MWSPEHFCRNLLIGLAFSLPALALAGCTLTPVYSDAVATQQKLRFSYAEPSTRLQQIVYQDLALRFGADAGADAPHLRVAVSQGGRGLTLSANPAPVEQAEAIVNGTATVIAPGGETLLTVSRSASAGYETNGQVFADREARIEAAERATHELAESLRLALIAGLAAR
jgi:hypothetical protein